MKPFSLYIEINFWCEIIIKLKVVIDVDTYVFGVISCIWVFFFFRTNGQKMTTITEARRLYRYVMDNMSGK